MMQQRPTLKEEGLASGKTARRSRLLFQSGLGNGTAPVPERDFAEYRTIRHAQRLGMPRLVWAYPRV